MKHFITYSVALMLMLLMGTNSYAKSWRVNSNPSRGAKFVDINGAMSSAEVLNDDTLYLDPGSNIGGQQVVTKRVTIIGYGYFYHLSQPYGYTTLSGGIVMKAANSKIEGVTIQSGCVISANNVTVERCFLNNSSISSNGNNCKNAIIRNCYITISNNYAIYGQGDTSSNTEGWIIDNNIITSIANYSGIYGLYSASILNNYVYYFYSNNYYCVDRMNNCTIINNILINKYYNTYIFRNLSDCVVHNNILSCNEDNYVEYPNNKRLSSSDEATIFIMTGNNDLKYRLCEESPAKGYAVDGGDCGPYGSGFTYVPGGLPKGIPYYTEANIATMDQDGKLKVSLKISVNNE